MFFLPATIWPALVEEYPGADSDRLAPEGYAETLYCLPMCRTGGLVVKGVFTKG